MKKLILLICIIINIIYFSACAGIKQNPDESKHDESLPFSETLFDTVNDKITDYFRGYFLNNKNYEKTEKDIFDSSSEGGTVEGFWLDNNLKMMRLHLYGEMGKIQTDYYIIDDNIIYTVITITEYDKPFYMDDVNIKVYYKELFIIDDKVMVYDTDKADLVESVDDFTYYTDFTSAKEAILNSDL